MTEQRPEGVLIANALKRSGLSARKAASAAGISDTRLRHIITGYQPAGGGSRIPVVAPADTLARIAFSLSILEDELRQAGRSDAADILADTFSQMATRDHPAREEVHAAYQALDSWRARTDFRLTRPPDEALELFTDEQLNDEIGRRLESRSATVVGIADLYQRAVDRISNLESVIAARDAQDNYDLAAYRVEGDPEDEIDPEALSQRYAGEENQDPDA